ncbi:MAG: hypothetical protein AAF848_12225 [Pseudomonadota bacterium]
MATFPETPPDGWRDDSPEMVELRAGLSRFVEADPFRRFGATAIGSGPRVRCGEYHMDPCVRIYVPKKYPRDALSDDLRVPSEVTLSLDGGGTCRVPTDVIEMSAPRPANGHKDLHRPVPGGVSVKVADTGGRGTLGGWVFDRTDETVVALTNHHVVGLTAGSACIQPVSVGGGFDPANRIGTVKRWHRLNVMPDPFTMADCNLIDAAVIAADDPDLIDLTVLDLGPAIYDTGLVASFTSVIKSGWVTGTTTGRIIDTTFHWPMTVNISPGVPRTFLMCWGLLFEGDPGTPPPGVIAQGDSGSILFIREDPAPAFPRATGLVYGIADGNGVACRIQDVFSALDLDVLCASGYPAYLDGLAADVAEPSGLRFTPAERTRPSGRLASTGLARSVDQRLNSSDDGKALAALIRESRHPIFQGLIRNGDLRRAATKALLPVLSGARISDDVLGHVVTRQDAANISALLKVLRSQGLEDLARRLSAQPLAKEEAIGRKVGALYKIKDM